MLDFIKVDLPKEKVFIAKSGKNQIKYVYYILKSYRNEKNQPTGKTISIGRYDEEKGLGKIWKPIIIKYSRWTIKI